MSYRQSKMYKLTTDLKDLPQQSVSSKRNLQVVYQMVYLKTMDKNTRAVCRVFTVIFSCLDIPVKYSLSLFIYISIILSRNHKFTVS